MGRQKGKKTILPAYKENPFVTSTAVLGKDFYGREREIEQVFHFLGKKKDHHLLIHGQRRIGKTSLLLKIKELVNHSRMGKAIFFDLQNKAKLDISEVLSELTKGICLAMDLNPDVIGKDVAGTEAGNIFKDEFLPRVLETLPKNCQLVLLFDEFDSLGDLEGVKGTPKISNIAYHKFIPLIGEIKEKELPLKFIFAVGRNYKDLDEGRYGQITKSSGQIELSYFEKKELEQLIRSSDTILPFELEAIERIYTYTSGHPFFSQCLSSTAFDEADRLNAQSVTPEMVDNNLEATIKSHGGGAIWLWQGFPPRDRIVLYLMAAVKEEKKQLNEKNIKAAASRLNLVPVIHELNDTLERLVNLKIIAKVKHDTPQYDFYVEFFRKWILIENSVEKIGMLLTEMNPDIKHNIRNGQYYYDQGNFKEAEKWFTDVINKFPSHYEALFYLGQISTSLMDKEKEYLEKALEWFSRAYALNPYGTKDEYLSVLKEKLNWLEENGEETENILEEIQKVNPGESKILGKLIAKYIIKEKDISRLDFLAGVTELNLSDKQLTGVPLEIIQLKALRTLDLSSNRIMDISLLRSIKSLTVLNLSGNRITDISPISALTALTTLHLSDNKIKDIAVVGSFTHLLVLNLRGNLISDISSLTKFKHLKRLDLTDNRISRIPAEILNIALTLKWNYHPVEDGCFLAGNPLESPPVEVVKRGLRAINNYFESLKSESVRLLEAKIIIVGNGEVGKTTLMQKLLDDNYKVEIGRESTTHGIKIEPWQLPCEFGTGETENVKIHFWDFGGQDIYHSTHQFFLTRRSLYLFVWEARKEEELSDFDYWLNVIKLLSDECPVIVVMNKSDIRIKHLDENGFKEKFNNIVAFLEVSCLTDAGIETLVEQIRVTLCHMPHLLDLLPRTWMNIRDHLNCLNKNYISLLEYLDICKSYGLDEQKAIFLSGYLHDLGAILHYHDSILENTLILNPEWVTEAVYRLIDASKILEAGGLFQFSHLKEHWDTRKYPPDKHMELIRLMEKFEICFNFVGTDNYFIPELLPPVRHPIPFEMYLAPSNLKFQYHYDFMPEGIIGRFIARNYYLIKEDRFWKYGVELNFEDSSALVLSEPLKKRVAISVRNSYKSELLAIIRREFEHIHQTLNMRKNIHYNEMIPCICRVCRDSSNPYLFNYDVLKRRMSKGLLNDLCNISDEEIAIEKLIKGVEAKKNQTSESLLLEFLILSAHNLQGFSKSIKPDEDSRNSVISMLLSAKGFMVKDHSRWGHSITGKSMGEVDFKIDTPDGKIISIIEAFNLSAFDRRIIELHLQKLFYYDVNGIPNNFILVYSEASDFNGVWKKYLDYLTQINFQYPLSEKPTEEKTPYTGIKSVVTRHFRDGKEVTLYHIFIDMKT